MSTLNVIGEFFHNRQSEINFAAARDLTIALADTAPRAYASALLIAADTVAPQIDHLKAKVEKIPLRSSMLPILWHTNQAARPLDGEFLHAFTPLVPLRTREEDDGSQTSVMIPNALAWDAPDTLPRGQARQMRSFTRRALKHADVIVTPTHALANRLRTIYGDAISPQVLPLAAPAEYIAGDDQQELRDGLKLPDRYILTDATLSETGRLDWLLEAYEKDPELPTLVVLPSANIDSQDAASKASDRVIVLNDLSLKQTGAVLAGAKFLAMPHSVSDCCYLVHAALEQGIPVLHAGSPSMQELTLDSGVAAPEKEDFLSALTDLVRDEDKRDRLAVLARDRARSFSWRQTAWQLWEIHAHI